jgi:hypothetical protein
MLSLSAYDLILTMSVCLFVMGVISVGIGVFILISKVLGEDIRVIANQTAKLAQKGVAEDVAGLVGNASSLIESLNQLVQTTSGVGMFLFVAGFILILAAYFLLRQIM